MNRGHSKAIMLRWLLVFPVLLTRCDLPVETTTTLVSTPTPTSVPAPTEEPTLTDSLDVIALYPGEDSELEMGRSMKLTVQVSDAQGEVVSDAQVASTVRDPGSETIAVIPAVYGSEGIYRTDYWTLPHRMPEGTWNVLVGAETGSAQGSCSSSFEVKNSTSEILLAKYGFWLDAPDFRIPVLQIGSERGDARNGLIRWGGSSSGMHIVPADYVEVHWREGNYRLENPEAVRQFVMEEGLGDLNDLRSIDLIQSVQFKHWDAWKAECGTHSWEEMELMIFYVPEVDKTYAIATTVTLPLVGLDLHEILRGSFAVFPDVHATGVAPEPLPQMLPGPELISPPLAARFQGLEEPSVLQWKPVKELAEDEYYEVVVIYFYRESFPGDHFTTRQTQFTIPETLYRSPNCSVFNWRVTLMRQTGLGDDGQPRGEPISHQSLYWYFWWQYPAGEEPDFPRLCPYTHLD